MVHRKVKLLICLVLSLTLLSGCSNKEENKNITESNVQTESTVKLDAPVKTDNTSNDNVQAATEEASTTVDNVQPDKEKEVVDTKTKSQPTEETKSVALTEEEFYSKDIVIPDDKPFEVTMSFGSANMVAAVNQTTSDMYYNLAGNEFMYIDGVNYLIDKNNPIKYKGDNIMLSDDTGVTSVSINTNIEESLSMLDTLKINDIDVVSGIIVINGDITYNDIITPSVLKIDYNTYEFISLVMNQNSSYVSLSMLDNWNNLPDFNYREVSVETFEERAKQSILALMAGAFSEENLTTESGSSSSETKSLYDYEIELEGLSEDAITYINTFTNSTLYTKYDIIMYSTDIDLDNTTYTIKTKRELSNEELISIKDELMGYLESISDTTLDE